MQATGVVSFGCSVLFLLVAFLRLCKQLVLFLLVASQGFYEVDSDQTGGSESKVLGNFTCSGVDRHIGFAFMYLSCRASPQ